MSEPAKSPLLTGRAYDTLKTIALVVLPALGAAYFGLAQIWGLPNGEEVVGTITIIDTLLGAVLGISSKAYNNSDVKYDGEVGILPTGEPKRITLNSDRDFLKPNQDYILKVVQDGVVKTDDLDSYDRVSPHGLI